MSGNIGFDGPLMQLADVGLMSLYIADCDAPVLAGASSRAQADAMIERYLLNPAKFGGAPLGLIGPDVDPAAR